MNAEEQQVVPEAPPVKNAYVSEEIVSDLLNFTLNTEANEAGGPAALVEGTHEIKLKFRQKAKAERAESLIQGRTSTGQTLGSRREKERVIGEVVIKVSEWRRMYSEQGITLEEAAKNIGISKKSLDDYFLQLR